MQTLVNEFRDYARLPAAQLTPLDLNALAGEVMALYGQAQDNGLLVHDLAPDLPRILGDATQLRQVIHNLVQNALDAVADRPDGQVSSSPIGGTRRAWRTARGAADGHRQWPGLRRASAQARLRTLRHHQAQGHRAWAWPW